MQPFAADVASQSPSEQVPRATFEFQTRLRERRAVQFRAWRGFERDCHACADNAQTFEEPTQLLRQGQYRYLKSVAFQKYIPEIVRRPLSASVWRLN